MHHRQQAITDALEAERARIAAQIQARIMQQAGLLLAPLHTYRSHKSRCSSCSQ